MNGGTLPMAVVAIAATGASLLSFAWLGACGGTRVEQEPAPEGAFPLRAQALPTGPEGLAFVTNNGSDTVSVVDLATFTVIRTVPVAIDPLAGNGPHHLALDHAHGEAFIPMAFPASAVPSGPHAAHGASARAGLLSKWRLADMTRITFTTVEESPGDVRLTPDGSRVLVSHFDLARANAALGRGDPVERMRATVYVLDARTLVPRAIVRPCVAPHGMDLSPDGNTAYVSCYGEDSIAVLHLDSPALAVGNQGSVELFPVGPNPGAPGRPTYGPYSVTYVEGALVVGEAAGKSLDVLDLATRAPRISIPLRGEAYFGVATEAGPWIVPTQAQDQLLLVNLADGTLLKTRPTGAGACVKPHQVARHQGRTFVVCEGDHVTPGLLVEVDPVSLETVRSLTLGVYPDAVAFTDPPRAR